MILVRASGAGIKREGLLYCFEKYGTGGGPEFGIKEEFLTEKGKAALPCACMNREACCLQLGQLRTGAKLKPSFSQWLHTGKGIAQWLERRTRD